VLGAIGVVYGDIGTSPLYTMAEVFSPANGVPLTAEAVTGAVSTLFWALMFVVTLKYVVLVLRADNRGEGGILALTALAAQVAGGRPGRRAALLMLGVFGATLFYGDSVITPAISVLGAVEGLVVVAPACRMRCCRCRWWCWWACSPCSGTARPRWGGCSGRSSCCGS
jgi:KUP system potassium uptake protein